MLKVAWPVCVFDHIGETDQDMVGHGEYQQGNIGRSGRSHHCTKV